MLDADADETVDALPPSLASAPDGRADLACCRCGVHLEVANGHGSIDSNSRRPLLGSLRVAFVFETA